MKLHPYQRKMLTKYGVIAAVIVLPVAGFVSGMQYQKSKESTPLSDTTLNVAGGKGMGMGIRRFGGGGGTVSAISAASITVRSIRDDTSKTYAITSTTTVLDGQDTASISDIKVGDTVIVMPSTTDETQAARIVLNPSFPGFGGPGAGAQEQGAAQTN